MTTIIDKNSDSKKFSALVLAGLATDQQLSAAKVEEIRAIKSDAGQMHYRAVPTEAVVKAPGENSRSYRFIASEESKDRMGDIIKVAGWDLRNFKRNPLALADHNASTSAIVGTITEMEKAVGEKPPRLYETVRFADAGVNPVADVTEKLVAAGLLRTVSVGFIPLVVKWPESDEEREKEGLGRWGCVYEKSEQLELSLVAIPCHPNAELTSKSIGAERLRMTAHVMRLVKAGAVSPDEAEAYLEVCGARSPRRIFPVQQVRRIATLADEPATPATSTTVAPLVDPHAATIKSLTDSNAELKARVEKLEGAHATLAADVAALPKPGAQPRSLATDPANYDVILNSPIKFKQTLLNALSKSA